MSASNTVFSEDTMHWKLEGYTSNLSGIRLHLKCDMCPKPFFLFPSLGTAIVRSRCFSFTFMESRNLLFCQPLHG